jgi:hypothetical protein
MHQRPYQRGYDAELQAAAVGSFLSKITKPLGKIAKVAVSPVLAMDKVLRKVPAYKKFSNLAPLSKERQQALGAAHAVMDHAHKLVTRAAAGDASAKQAIGSVLTAASKGDAQAQAAVHALTAARMQIKLFGPESRPDLMALSDRAASLRARGGATAGELAIVRGLPRMNAVELVTAGGQWLSTAGGDVFVPAAYRGTAGARAARRQTLKLGPRTAQQVRWAFAQERRGGLPFGTARRWAHRAVSGFESAHGGAQTLREWLGEDPALNIALK